MFNFILYYFQKEVKNSYFRFYRDRRHCGYLMCQKREKNLSSCVSSYFIETESLKTPLFTGFILKLRLHLIKHSFGFKNSFLEFQNILDTFIYLDLDLNLISYVGVLGDWRQSMYICIFPIKKGQQSNICYLIPSYFIEDDNLKHYFLLCLLYQIFMP